jgi:hypothetical protein
VVGRVDEGMIEFAEELHVCDFRPRGVMRRVTCA